VSAAPWSRLLALEPSAGACAPADAAARLAAALAAEPSPVLMRPTPAARALHAQLPSRPPVVAVLPDMPQLLRDAAEIGLPRAALARLLPGGPRAWWRLGLTGVRHVREVAGQDFRGLVPVLLELERASLRGVDVCGAALAAQLTDLLLAAGHREALQQIVAHLRRAGLCAGLQTLNLGHLLERLAAWQVRPDFVIGPLNPRGFRMKPTPDAVRAALRTSGVPLLASEITAGGTVALSDAIAAVRADGAGGVVIAVNELAG
jgi:beta-phosphoglucomutase-like phosphatase (HAD superfamily)